MIVIAAPRPVIVHGFIRSALSRLGGSALLSLLDSWAGRGTRLRHSSGPGAALADLGVVVALI